MAQKAKPQLIVKTINGENFDLQEKLGKVVIVNFWVSWCLNCHAEIKILKELYSQYHQSGLEIIGVSVDRKKDYKDFAKIAKELNYPSGLFTDIKQTNFEEPTNLPTTYIIDRTGNLINLDILQKDEMSKKDFEKILQQVL